MQPVKLGRIEVIQVAESNTPTSPRFLFPGITPADFAPYLRWLAPQFYVPETDRFPMAIQAFLVRTPHHTLVVDPCVGNDKKRSNPLWHQQRTPFLQRLQDAGVRPQEVDFVLCTHLHVDHVGWNTRLVNGRWEPTFPNARYLFDAREYAFWSQVRDDEEQVETFRDSVLPVMEAGKAVLVEGAHEVTAGVVLEPTPGHTPGHCSVHLTAERGEAVITGDMVHHPLQLLEPERCSRFAWDPVLTRQTRRAFLERYAERDVRIVGSHFALPTHGHVVGHEDAFRLEV